MVSQRLTKYVSLYHAQVLDCFKQQKLKKKKKSQDLRASLPDYVVVTGVVIVVTDVVNS